MSDVSVIGLGAMGSALARVLLRGGHRVTVWNRTAGKADPLLRDGAAAADHRASAVTSSPVVLVCVADYDVTRAILGAHDVRPGLAGRVLVQVSTGTPKEARDLERWALESGAEYLDGAILAYPDQMGTPDAAVLVAGPEATFARCEPLLRSLGGGLRHVGEPVGAASALDCAALSFVFGGLLGAIHGARVCEAEELRVDEFGAMLAELMPVMSGEILQLSARIQAGRFGDSQATLGTYAAAARRLLQQTREGTASPDFPAFVSALLEKGTAAGLGDQDLAALIKVLR